MRYDLETLTIWAARSIESIAGKLYPEEWSSGRYLACFIHPLVWEVIGATAAHKCLGNADDSEAKIVAAWCRDKFGYHVPRQIRKFLQNLGPDEVECCRQDTLRRRVFNPTLPSKGQSGEADALIDRHGLSEQAVIVRCVQGACDARNTHQVLELIERLAQAIRGADVGRFNGVEWSLDLSDGSYTGVELFMYGPDADVLFAVVKPILAASSLGKGATVRLRYGPAGGDANERKLVLDQEVGELQP